MNCYSIKNYDLVELPFTTYDWTLMQVLEKYYRTHGDEDEEVQDEKTKK